VAVTSQEAMIFCQNVNRNYGYMDMLLASLYDEYDSAFYSGAALAAYQICPLLSVA
jgi:hypothetical protein